MPRVVLDSDKPNGQTVFGAVECLSISIATRQYSGMRKDDTRLHFIASCDVVKTRAMFRVVFS